MSCCSAPSHPVPASGLVVVGEPTWALGTTSGRQGEGGGWALLELRKETFCFSFKLRGDIICLPKMHTS